MFFAISNVPVYQYNGKIVAYNKTGQVISQAISDIIFVESTQSVREIRPVFR